VARFLRIIRQARWFAYPDIPWLAPGELQADALSDLRTEGNSLSVWLVGSDPDERRIVVALAANRERLDVFDYVVFEDTRLVGLGVHIAPVDADTPDAAVNQFHRELRNLTVRQLAELAVVVSVGRRQRTLPKSVKSRLIEALQAGTLNRGKLNPKLLAELE